MKRLLIALLFALIALPVHAQSITPGEQAVLVKNIQTYLNGMTTLKARFRQVNQDGTIDSGVFYLRRPGRLRFEYDAPKDDYIVADGLLVHYWDDGIKNYSNAPIGSTLADFLLRKKIKLSGDLKVTGLTRPRDNYLLLTLAQADNPEMGDVRLLFTEQPLQLLKWRVTDGTGAITETSLAEIKNGVTLDPRLFVFKPPAGYDAGWQNTR